jgi:secreted Zn-dependent insulinase-like peptidase
LINDIRDYKDLSLVEEANRIWKEIKDNRGTEDFNRNEKKIIALEKVTKESVQAWFNKLFFE